MRLELTKTEIEYLYNLVSRSIDSGSYYGNSTQYYARQKRVKKAILDVLCPLPDAKECIMTGECTCGPYFTSLPAHLPNCPCYESD